MEKRVVATAVVALLLGPGAARPETPPQELSAADAVKLALSGNVDLRVESLSASISEEEVKRSRGIYDPLLRTSLVGGAGPFEQPTTGFGFVGVTQLLPTGATLSVSTDSNLVAPRGLDSSFSSNLVASVVQPLQRGAGKQATESAITLARYGRRDSLDRFRLSALDTVLATLTAYNRLYTLRQALDARKRSLDQGRQLLADTRRRVEGGTLQPLDLTNAQFAAAQRLKDVVDAERNVQDQQANLRYLVGLPVDAEIVPIDPPTRREPEGSGEDLVKIALERRADLRQLRTALESSTLQERLASNQARPDVSLIGTAQSFGQGGTFGDNVQQMREGQSVFSAALHLSVPLGNRAAAAEVRKARIRTEQVKTQIQALSLRIRNEVESDLRALISARLQIRLSEDSVQQAEERLDLYRRNREAGTATTQDVLFAETDLAFAVTSRLDAIDSYAAAVLKLWRDTGELLDQLGIPADLAHPAALTAKAGEGR